MILITIHELRNTGILNSETGKLASNSILNKSSAPLTWTFETAGFLGNLEFSRKLGVSK